MEVFKLPGFKFDENLFGSAEIDTLRLSRCTVKVTCDCWQVSVVNTSKKTDTMHVQETVQNYMWI